MEPLAVQQSGNPLKAYGRAWVAPSACVYNSSKAQDGPF
jgi:hypothetical protein